MPNDSDCKGCGATVRLAEEQLAAILAEYLRDHPGELVDDATYAARISHCRECDALEYGTTCRHCGCLVPVMAKFADKHCPRPGGRAW